MSHRVNHNQEQLVEHLEEREWPTKDVERWVHLIRHSALLSFGDVLHLLQDQQLVDERIAAEKAHDRWAIGSEFATQPTTYLSDAGWDTDGNYHPPVLGRTDEVNAHFQGRLEGME